MHILCLVNMLRYNFANKITLFFCSFFIFSLFFHIFHQFIHRELSFLHGVARFYLINSFALTVFFVTAFFIGKKVYLFNKSPNSICCFLRRRGEDQTVLFLFKCMYIPSMILVLFLPFWLLVTYYFVSWSFFEKILYLLLSSAACFVGYFFLAIKSSFFKISSSLIILSKESVEQILYEWKLKRSFKKNSDSFIILLFALLLVSVLCFLFFFNINFFSLLLISYLAGFLIGGVCCLQISEDFRTIWLERNTGVSHKNYMHSVFSITKIYGLFGVCPIFFFSFISLAFKGYAFNIETLSKIIKLLLVFSLPIWLVNCIALQLDPRNIKVQMMVLFISSLFLCSAIAISPFFLILCPFLL